MKRISREVSHAKPRYTAIVIGSGYGGGIAASRLARAGQSVCLLERGSERLPGEYPDSLKDLKGTVQLDTVKGHYGPHRAMFDIRMNDDITAVIGCGLGGTSLINANVALEVEKGVFEVEDWPQVFRDDPNLLDPYYERARSVLDPSPYPDDAPTLNKVEALKTSAQRIDAPFRKPPINVNFQDQVNPFGVYQPACNNCGDCCSGCNYGSKNTTLMNYLPDAHNHGAEIFTNASVRRVERDDAAGEWIVHVEHVPEIAADGMHDKPEIAAPVEIRADIVVVAAGTLGTAEILRRSEQHGLTMSDSLGQGFSGNGDVLAFGYNNYWKSEKDEAGNEVQVAINGIGQGDNDLPAGEMPGPCIAGLIDTRERDGVEKGMVIEEGVIPGALASVIPAAYFGAEATSKSPFAYGPSEVQSRLESAAKLASAVQSKPTELSTQSYTGPVARSQTYLVMSHDDAEGELVLADDDRLRVEWPDAGREQVYDRDDHMLQRVNGAIHGQFLPNPLWSEAMGRQLVTVHPVGGCRMADSFADGVVDDRGRVWSGPGQHHPGLYVTDGSVMPGSVGVNPLLTISAFAERSMELLIEEQGWHLDTTLAPRTLGTRRFVKAKPGRTASPAGQSLLGRLLAPVRGLLHLVLWVLKVVWGWIKEGIKKLITPIIFAMVKRNPERYAPAMQFTETMEGFISTELGRHRSPHRERISDDFELSFARGEMADTPIDFKLTLATDDLWELTTAPDRPATAAGEVHCQALSAQPMTVRDGVFNLLPPEADRVESWLMTYDLTLDRAEGSALHFVGHKHLHKTDDSNPWTDLTKLFVTIADTETGEVVAEGIMTLDLQDFIQQGSTLEITPKSEGIARFGPIRNAVMLYFLAKFAGGFGQTVINAYGGLLSDLNNFAAKENRPEYPKPRVRRPLKLPAGCERQDIPILADDGAALKLIRFNGGGKGPVILSPGFSVTADSFAIDTVDENIVEYLTQRGYDVWLFAYRGSPDSGSSATSFTIDDIASYDWPAALRHVHDATGKQVQVVAHCVASMSLMMSILAGTPEAALIRHIISSQLTVHPITNWLNEFKADLGIVPLIRQVDIPSMGIDLREKIDLRATILPANATKKDMAGKALDAALWLVPVPEGEECTNPVCKRVFSVFGPSYTHGQLNHKTHIAMEEMFGEIATRPFGQLAEIVRQGQAVDADGRDVYLQGVEHLSMPIDFIAGRQNQIFVPETSQRTYDWVRTHNPHGRYSRHVFQDYAHMDLWIGRTANVDIFPFIEEKLEAALNATETVSPTPR